MVRLCPKCGRRVDLEARFCGGCGERLPKASADFGADDADREPGALLLAAEWFFELFPGLLRPGVTVFSVLALAVALGVWTLAAFVGSFGAIISAFFIGGFGVVVYWTAISWMMYGEMALPSEAMADFSSKQWMTFMMLTLVPMAAVIYYSKARVGRTGNAFLPASRPAHEVLWAGAPAADMTLTGRPVCRILSASTPSGRGVCVCPPSVRKPSMKTYLARKEDYKNNRRWYHVDATDKVLGRVSTRIAMALMGKDTPEYTPHVDTGAYVVVTNAEKVRLTGRKALQKTYDRYSGYPGGRKEVTFEEMLEKHPERIIKESVRRMLPKNKLGAQMLKKLKVYAGPEHPHTYHKPSELPV